MLFTDTFRTIRSHSEGSFRDRGSRFLAFADPVRTQEETKALIDHYVREYHDARHHCYAYLLGSDKSSYRTNDDGEPSGSAGKPILGQINSRDLTNIMLIVVRYFGGTLLGVPGLINAYRSAASDALNNSEIIECIVREYYRIAFPYESMNDVMKIIKDENIIQSDQQFEVTCSITIGMRLSLRDSIMNRFSLVKGVSFHFIGRH